jgi:AbrB family looped-hinge helix DNA binding protein
MFATLTSKGQLTLPKEIRDRLNLDAGAILDFQIQADNTITARQVQPDASAHPRVAQIPACCATDRRANG